MSTLGPQEALPAPAVGDWEMLGRDMIATKRSEKAGGEIVAQFWTSPAPEHARLMVAAPRLAKALRDLLALMDRDAAANASNYAEIVLDEPEVLAARDALLKAEAP